MHTHHRPSPQQARRLTLLALSVLIFPIVILGFALTSQATGRTVAPGHPGASRLVAAGPTWRAIQIGVLHD